MMTFSMSRRLSLFVLLLVLALWRAPAAQAQFGMSLSPSSASALPGDDLIFSGELTNTGTTSLDLNNAYFNLLTGPSTADLTSAIFFANYDGPLTLDPSQVYDGPIIDLGTDPGAPVGDYTGNIAIDYGTGPVGQDVTMTLLSPNQNPPAVPEPGTLALAAFGLSLFAFRARRRMTGRA